MNNLIDLEKKINSELTTKINKSSIKHDQIYVEIDKEDLINVILSPKNTDPEQLSAYECGFEPFQDSRMEFDVRFYLVAILFIIFDLEIAFLFPWAISLGNIGILGFTSMMIFLFILTVGFIYEWKKGALDWE